MGQKVSREERIAKLRAENFANEVFPTNFVKKLSQSGKKMYFCVKKFSIHFQTTHSHGDNLQGFIAKETKDQDD